MMRWSHVETMNAVRECSRFIMEAQKSHMKALIRIMEYICGTAKRGLFLKPSKWWDSKLLTNGRLKFEKLWFPDNVVMPEDEEKPIAEDGKGDSTVGKMYDFWGYSDNDDHFLLCPLQ